jgi:glutamine amidotransferase|nr:imidazole glycerol phosphate synthase subunit HisH [Kofleriaceae bacterium]
MIAVVDVCGGNLRSVSRALARAGGDVVVTRDAEVVRRADKVVVPGQGAFDVFMHALGDGRGLGDALRDAIARGVPYLGICLGMQVLFEHGAEGDCAGLGVLRGRVDKLPAGGAVKVPHVGWSSVEQATGPRPRTSAILGAIDDGAYFYFTHSYRAVPADRDDIALEAEHGVRFCAAIARDHIFACQFHPEKSQAAGLRLLAAFV